MRKVYWIEYELNAMKPLPNSLHELFDSEQISIDLQHLSYNRPQVNLEG